MMNGLGIGNFLLTFILVYGGVILFSFIYALIALFCLHDILIEEIDMTEKILRRMEI